MTQEVFDNIIDNIISLKPIMIKFMVRPKKYKGNMTPGMHVLMMVLKNHKSMTMSEIGKNLIIPKPNVTALVDKLLDLKLVEKIHDKKDRRKVFVTLSAKGIKSVNHINSSTRQNIKQILLSLSENDLEILADSLQSVRKVFYKIQTFNL